MLVHPNDLVNVMIADGVRGVQLHSNDPKRERGEEGDEQDNEGGGGVDGDVFFHGGEV
tara:strand:- start:13353 stop:13526 length:174 start_codon:yes stop_codon:yes gene_type:complete